MEAFKAALKFALSHGAAKVVFKANQYPLVIAEQGQFPFQERGIHTQDAILALTRTLVPGGQSRLQQGQPAQGQMTVVNHGQLRLLAIPGTVPSLTLYIPPKGEDLFRMDWQEAQQTPASHTPPASARQHGSAQGGEIPLSVVPATVAEAPMGRFVDDTPAAPPAEDQSFAGVPLSQFEMAQETRANTPQHIDPPRPESHSPVSENPFSLPAQDAVSAPSAPRAPQSPPSFAGGFIPNIPLAELDAMDPLEPMEPTKTFAKAAPEPMEPAPAASPMQADSQLGIPADLGLDLPFELPQLPMEAPPIKASGKTKNTIIPVPDLPLDADLHQADLESLLKTPMAAVTPIPGTPQHQPGAPMSGVTSMPVAPVSHPAPTIHFGPHIPGQTIDNDGTNAIDGLLREMVQQKASDLHLTLGEPPSLRKDGDIHRLQGQRVDPAYMSRLLLPIMPEANKREFAEKNDTDFAYEIPGLARFRVNMFRDMNGVGSVLRQIPSEVLTADQLGLAPAIRKLCSLSKGLVIVTGPTGSGKSTTLAGMIDLINASRHDHIITIEDPIEFVHKQKNCLINQREVHRHTQSFSRALRAALREDPDIVLIGEMRDLETVSIAIETAETGHLVFGTLHTNTAISTIDRIIDQFPTNQQAQVRIMLSESLKGVISQTLVKKIGGGRAAAQEVLIVNKAVSALIREAKTHMISNHMQTQKNDGNVLLNEALLNLVTKKLVDPKDAYMKAVDKESFLALLQQKGVSTAFITGQAA